MILTLIASQALAGAIDQVEVGGPWGTPTATDATAIWWNPAGLAAGEGTRFMGEAAPISAVLAIERDDPFGRGGKDVYTTLGVVPFAGVATDLGVKGLGLGAGFVVPYANGATSEIEDPHGRYHLRSGLNQHFFYMLGAGYEYQDRFAIGVAGALIQGEYAAHLDTSLVPQLDGEIANMGEESGYTDELVEDPDYAATLTYKDDGSRAFTFSAGSRVVITDQVVVGLAYIHGFKAKHRGNYELDFDCPPQSDTLGRFGAEQFDLCYANLLADGGVSFGMPARFHMGVQVTPIDNLRLELMGGWVGWHAFEDYLIEIENVEELNELDNPETADLVNQTKVWARDGQDAAWFALDAKMDPIDVLTIGTRITRDGSAIPDHALSQNNYDAASIRLSGLVAVRPVPQLEIGASITGYFLQDRLVEDSSFSLLVSEETEDRWAYPHANGLYQSATTRFGLSVRGHFAKPDPDTRP